MTGGGSPDSVRSMVKGVAGALGDVAKAAGRGREMVAPGSVASATVSARILQD